MARNAMHYYIIKTGEENKLILIWRRWIDIHEPSIPP